MAELSTKEKEQGQRGKWEKEKPAETAGSGHGGVLILARQVRNLPQGQCESFERF